jgi:hypothetical protein
MRRDTHNSHQAWLASAYKALHAKYLPQAPKPKDVIVSYGFTKGRGRKGTAIGQCFADPVPAKKRAVIFVHPCQWTTPLDVLHVLLHEAIHAQFPKAGHKAEFADMARALGLEGKMTATVPSKTLAAELKKLAKKLPTFPKAAFNPFGKQVFKGSTLRRWVCPCGVKARVASDEFEAQCLKCDGQFKHVELPRKPERKKAA